MEKYSIVLSLLLILILCVRALSASPGPRQRLRIGNTNSRLCFTPSPEDDFDIAAAMNRWVYEGPMHHVALGMGHFQTVVLNWASPCY